MTLRTAALVLSNGEVFEGEAIGAVPVGGFSSGEVVFNTAMTGYQEILTDPSYAGQIITFTYPHVGNYGVVAADDESLRPFCRGVVVRDLSRRCSSWRADSDLDGFLRRHGLSGIAGLDTRRLTRHLRDHGSVTGAFGEIDEATLLEAAMAEPGTDGVDLVAQVTCGASYSLARHDGVPPRRIVAWDLGIKATIIEHLRSVGDVVVVPAGTSAGEILGLEPSGVFLSNGPGDPEAVSDVPDALREVLGSVPVFGICLGHQMLCLALGGETYKLPFGHHGANHPVRNLRTGKIEITSQNHNFAVREGSVPSAEVSHVNLNDGVVEGVRCQDIPAFGVQHHPEAGPGPHDSSYLFEEFASLMDSFREDSRAH